MIGSQDSSERRDRELAAAAQQGNRQAFSELVDRHRDSVVRVVYRMVGEITLAEDAAQEAFLRAWQRLHTYKPQYPFRSWIYGIAIHAALDMLRQEPLTDNIEDLAVKSGEPGPEEQGVFRERAEKVRQAVMALPPASRAVLVLREYEGLAYAEIARTLDIPIGTVMSRLNYARGQLRQALAPYMESL